MSRVLVTGATGFVGGVLCPVLIRAGYDVIAHVRKQGHPNTPEGVTPSVVPDIGPDTDWTAALGGVEAVVHLAARVHVMKEKAGGALAKFNRTNADGTASLAAAAAAAGVRRFVYLSTVKVMGETSAQPFRESDTPHPEDAYGKSKLAGEKALIEAAEPSGMETVILRPPLVYGPGAKGNVLSLLKFCRLAPPLPFSAVDNRRSLIHVGNLADAILLCLDRKEATGQTYFVRDGEDLSTPDLIRRLAAALGRPARFFPVPEGFLRLAGRITGKDPEVDRALGNLQINDDKIRRELGWTPPVNVVQGLNETASWFATEKTAQKR